MYSPTARLLAVLEILQSNRSISGAEIARRLEIDVRTVRRYIATLQDMGIPIEGERGPDGAYTLGRGHRLPPLLFNEDEAVALVLGLTALRTFHFPVDVAAAEGALAKTERVIPEAVFRRVRSLRNAIVFNPSAYLAPPPPLLQNRFIILLTSAIQEHQRVQLHYRSLQGALSQRAVDLYGLVYNEGYWYAAGYCHLRHDLRTFRLDRIIEVTPLPETFERREDFDALEYVLKSIALSPSTYEVEMLLYTSLEIAQSVFTSADGVLEEVPEGILLRRNIAELDWLATIVLHAPFEVRILQPPELRKMVLEMSAKAMRAAGALP